MAIEKLNATTTNDREKDVAAAEPTSIACKIVALLSIILVLAYIGD